MMTDKCPKCNNTGWYGDNGPGVRGNNEFNRCECGRINKCTEGYHSWVEYSGVPWCAVCDLEADMEVCRVHPITKKMIEKHPHDPDWPSTPGDLMELLRAYQADEEHQEDKMVYDAAMTMLGCLQDRMKKNSFVVKQVIVTLKTSCKDCYDGCPGCPIYRAIDDLENEFQYEGDE